MRNVILLSATTAGSVAFQMSVDAGFVKNYAWAVPWVWASCAALWALWLITHDRVRKQWLRSFHERAGQWVIALRAALCVGVFFCVGILIGSLLKKPVTRITVKAEVKQDAQQSKPENDKAVNQKDENSKKRGAKRSPNDVCIIQ